MTRRPNPYQARAAAVAELGSLGLMRAIILGALLAAEVSSAATAVEPGIEPVTAEDIAKLKALGPNAIFIADGHAELILHVSVVNSVTHRPIPRVKVSAVRDRRVSRHLGRSYRPLPACVTDDRGRATLKGEFPMAADAEGSSVFVLDSYVAVAISGYVASRAPLSPIYRLDFPRGRKRYEVPIQISLRPR